MNTKEYSAYGVWEVTTEGDCDGRTTRHLGTHEGYLDEIAFALADQCYYSLNFKLTKKLVTAATHTSVSVCIDNGDGYDKNLASVMHMMRDRPVRVTKSNYYASYVLTLGRTQKETDEYNKEIVRRKAIAKLSIDEQKILGLLDE